MNYLLVKPGFYRNNFIKQILTRWQVALKYFKNSNFDLYHSSSLFSYNLLLNLLIDLFLNNSQVSNSNLVGSISQPIFHKAVGFSTTRINSEQYMTY